MFANAVRWRQTGSVPDSGMGLSAVRRQLLFLLLTALVALVAAPAARFGLEEGTGKLVVLWIFSIATPLILAQGLFLRSALAAVARDVDTTPPPSAQQAAAASAVADARETIHRLESRIRELEVETGEEGDADEAADPSRKSPPAPASGADVPRGSTAEGRLAMVEGLKSMMVDGGERAQAVLSGGSRLEIGITLAPEELADIRKMMSAIGRVISRPSMEEIAETTPGDGTVRLLLVDDDRTCRRIFRAMLPKDIPALAVECDDGNAALAALEIPPYPDIIVCDIMMPNLDGFEFIKKVRDMPRVCQTPIIMVTSNAFRENVSRAAQLNVCRFLKKPLTRADVESAVRFAMTQNERKRSSIIEAQQRLCLDDRAYFELACGFSRAVTESITFVRSAISRDRWQMASIRVNALHGSIQLVGDDRLAAVLGRVSVELTHWDVNRVTIELEALEQENERFARTLIQLFTDNSGASPQAKPDAGESLPAGEAAVPVSELA